MDWIPQQFVRRAHHRNYVVVTFVHRDFWLLLLLFRSPSTISRNQPDVTKWLTNIGSVGRRVGEKKCRKKEEKIRTYNIEKEMNLYFLVERIKRFVFIFIHFTNGFVGSITFFSSVVF